MDNNRIVYCANVFISALNLQYCKLNPENSNILKSLEEYPEKHRSALILSIAQALKASQPAADANYISWTERNNN